MDYNKKLRKKEIEHELVEMESYLSEIKDFFPSEEEDFLHLGIEKHGIYKLIESAIESVIKICSIINSDLKLGIPSDEENIFRNLEKKKIISKKLSTKLIEMKSFRNVLVHKYGKIDDSLAFHNIEENLDDFEDFKKEILNFL